MGFSTSVLGHGKKFGRDMFWFRRKDKGMFNMKHKFVVGEALGSLNIRYEACIYPVLWADLFACTEAVLLYSISINDQ